MVFCCSSPNGWGNVSSADHFLNNGDTIIYQRSTVASHRNSRVSHESSQQQHTVNILRIHVYSMEPEWSSTALWNALDPGLEPLPKFCSPSPALLFSLYFSFKNLTQFWILAGRLTGLAVVRAVQRTGREEELIRYEVLCGMEDLPLKFHSQTIILSQTAKSKQE